MAPDTPALSAPMGRLAFGEALDEEATALLQLVSARNEAYAGPDALKCWRKRGLKGLLIRLEDKLCRFETYLEQGGATEAEWRELLHDLGGYALCGLVWLGRGKDANVRGEDDDESTV